MVALTSCTYICILIELKMSAGIKEETQIRIDAEMDGVELRICSAKTNLTEAYLKGMLRNLLCI